MTHENLIALKMVLLMFCQQTTRAMWSLQKDIGNALTNWI